MDIKFEKFLCEASLYDKLPIQYEDLDDLVVFLNGIAKPNVFCIKCGEHRIFNADMVSKVNVLGKSQEQKKELERFNEFINYYKIRTLQYVCSKDNLHHLTYFIKLTDSYIMKIGQYPSYADIENPQIKKYQKALGKYYSELNKAIGLFSCKVGIGSFVYLRRIIEKLVLDAFKEAEKVGAITNKEFEFQADGKHRNGMEEKIKLLKGFLPDLITDQPKIYGVVSKGIHELSEEDCLEYFPILKNGIILILDDIVTKKEKETNAIEYKQSLDKIVATEYKKT